VTIGLIVFGVSSVGPRISDYFVMQTQINQLQAKLDAAKENLENITEEKKRWDDPVYIRSQARSRLFYVMPGEISFTVMDADLTDANDDSGTVGAALAAARNTTSLSKDVSTTKTNWTENLVETVVRAGLEEPKA
jgi:hypothetical protein